MIDRACISLNHRCNLHCRYCHFADKSDHREQNAMEFCGSEAKAILDNIATYCKQNGILVFKLGIVGAGEPLLSFTTLATIVNHARAVGNTLFKMYTITNGIDVTEEQLGFFKENRDIITLNFSLDGYEELHNVYRQKFRTTMESIHRYEHVFGHKPIINCTVTKPSIINKNKLIPFFVDNHFTHINFSIAFGVSDDRVSVFQDEYSAFLDDCDAAGLTMRQRNKTDTQIHDCAMYGRRCGVGRTNVFFARDGVYPCGRFFKLKQ